MVKTIKTSYKIIIQLVAFSSISSCDNYRYKGMDGKEALAKANHMDLHQAYGFYVDTYKGTHPPMLDVASTFARFGPAGKTYIAAAALRTSDPREFNADLEALLVLNNKCSSDLRSRFSLKARALGVGESLVTQACRSD